MPSDNDIKPDMIDIKKKYHYAPLFFGPAILILIFTYSIFGLLGGLYLIFKDRTYEFLSSILALSSFGAFFLFCFLCPIVFNYIPSPFQKSRKLIQSFEGHFSMKGYSWRTHFDRLLIYSDGIEIRVFFNAFFIPYEELLVIKCEKKFFSKRLLILTALQSVPSPIWFNSSSNELIISYIRRTLQNNQDGTEPYERFLEKAGSKGGKISKDSLAAKMKSMKYSKKVIASIVLLEIAVILLIGPAMIAIKKMTFKPSGEDIRLFNHNEYEPIYVSGTPEAYDIVEVTYDENNEVIEEKYYYLSGKIEIAYLRNGKRVGGNLISGSNLILFAFGVLGVLLIAFGWVFYEHYYIYGLTFLITSIIFWIFRIIRNLL